MQMLLLEMFDSLTTELSRLLETRHRSHTSAGTDINGDGFLLDAKIARLRKALDRLQVAIGPECVLLH